MEWKILEAYISKLQILKNELKMLKNSVQPTQLSRANSVRKPSDQVRKSKSRNEKEKFKGNAKNLFKSLLLRNFGTFSYPGKNPLNFGDYEIIW